MEKNIATIDTYNICCLPYRVYIKLLILCDPRHICFCFLVQYGSFDIFPTPGIVDHGGLYYLSEHVLTHPVPFRSTSGSQQDRVSQPRCERAG